MRNTVLAAVAEWFDFGGLRTDLVPIDVAAERVGGANRRFAVGIVASGRPVCNAAVSVTAAVASAIRSAGQFAAQLVRQRTGTVEQVDDAYWYQVSRLLTAIRDRLKYDMPKFACHDCHGKGCQECNNQGYYHH